jgi:hypothetical protein
MIDKNTSRVFDILKFGSICLVFFGHFFANQIPLIWIPVTTALLVFSFSSGYFTHLKYKDHLDVKAFWKNKFHRMGIKLFIINGFLLLVFIFQGKTDIWTWQSLVNMAGLTGILNWFHIPNTSPFGRGFWFFTLLIFFYLAYPGLRRIQPQHSKIFMMLFLFLAYIFSRLHDPGHALYLTSAGFITGVCVAGGGYRMLSPFVSLSLCILFFFAMLTVNLIFKLNTLNFFFIFFFSFFFIFAAARVRINDELYRYASIFTPCVFEIYLLHQYFSIRPTENQIINFMVAFIIVLSLSIMLNRFSKVLTR